MKSKIPLISIVMLNYNGLRYIKKTILPILKLDYPKYEFIIIDNNSTDESTKYIESIQKKINKFKIKLIKNKKNLGYSKGKNQGVSYARGKYVLLLDEDILINNENLLKKLTSTFNKHKDLLFLSLLLIDNRELETRYYGGFYSFYGPKKRKKIAIKKLLDYKDELIKIGSPDGGALFFKKEDFQKTGCYDESQPYHCDVGDLGIRAMILTNKNNYLYTKAYLIHLGNNRITNNKTWCWKYKYLFLGFSKIIFKNYKFTNILKIYPCFLIFMILKTIRNLISKKDLCIVKSLLYSIKELLFSILYILAERKKIQSKRIAKEDIFLKIKLPSL